MTPVQIIAAVEGLISLAMNLGVNVRKLLDMREQSGGKLTDEQLQELADDAQAAIDRL